MPIKGQYNLEVRSGTLEFMQGVRHQAPFLPLVIDFCSDLSRLILKNEEARDYPDLMTFAYYCRRANLHRLRLVLPETETRLCRGIVLHIAPANIPINFAFSFLFGILCGNANLVRLPSKKFRQIEIFMNSINKLFEIEKYKEMEGRNAFVNFERDSNFLHEFSAVFDAMLLWGGDETIEWMRKLRRKPRCVELAFADRHSMAVMDGSAVLSLDESGLQDLCGRFFNDSYLVDQNACSSPHMVVWLGDTVACDQASEKFWNALEKIVKIKTQYGAMHLIEKKLRIMHCLERSEIEFKIQSFGAAITVAKMQSMAGNPADLRGIYGIFFEKVADSLRDVLDVIDGKSQTITYFGVTPDFIRDELMSSGCRGIDRIVPIGSALDIGMRWDGHSIAHSLTRVIDIH